MLVINVLGFFFRKMVFWKIWMCGWGDRIDLWKIEKYINNCVIILGVFI